MSEELVVLSWRWSVALLWSGGIDSTALAARLCSAGYSVLALTGDVYRERMPLFTQRERAARHALAPMLSGLAAESGGSFEVEHQDLSWLWAFATPGTDEIPTRNRRMIDFVVERHLRPRGWRNLAMGEYVGADSWVVKDHVSGADADHRSLSAYMLSQYGMDYRLLSLQDFGESRFKSDRLGLGFEAPGGEELMAATTNCLGDFAIHCGACYKCVERAAAHDALCVSDPTDYAADPREQERYPLYLRQMAGGLP